MPFDVEHYLGYFAMGLCALSAVGVEGAAACVLFTDISQLQQNLVKFAKRIAPALMDLYAGFCCFHFRADPCLSHQRLFFQRIFSMKSEDISCRVVWAQV